MAYKRSEEETREHMNFEFSEFLGGRQGKE